MSETDLQKLINDSNKILQFKEFLQLINPHSGMNNFNFYLACIDFKKRCAIDCGKSLLRHIRLIYRTYIKIVSNNSISSICICNQTRKSIRTKIKIMNETNIDCTIFHRAFQEVEEYLEKKFIDEFQNHFIIKQITESHSCANTNKLDNDMKYNETEISGEYSSILNNKKSSKHKTSDEFDPNKFHQMLTERLSQLKLPLGEENSFKKLSTKTNNDLLLKMIHRTQTIDIDIEADALSALDNQYNKIGRYKPEEMNNNININNNNNHNNILAYEKPNIKDSKLHSNIPFLWRCKLQNQDQ